MRPSIRDYAFKVEIFVHCHQKGGGEYVCAQQMKVAEASSSLRSSNLFFWKKFVHSKSERQKHAACKSPFWTPKTKIKKIKVFTANESDGNKQLVGPGGSDEPEYKKAMAKSGNSSSLQTLSQLCLNPKP